VDEPTVAVGRVTKVHGVRGEVAVENRSDNPDRWAPGARVFDERGAAYTVAAVRPHGGRLLVTFEEIADRTAAQVLVGVTLVVPESSLPELGQGEWWAFQAEGLRVSSEDGRDLGTVREVLAYPAQDLWRIVGDDGAEILVPVVSELVVEVNLEERRAVVRSLPGLTAPEA
jgi:16S rRNA processing protein RimM